MSKARFISLVAASLITAAQWAMLIWLLSPVQAEAAPIANAAPDQMLPAIVVTAHRFR